MGAAEALEGVVFLSELVDLAAETAEFFCLSGGAVSF